MPYGITQCYLIPDRGDIPAITPAEAGTLFSDPGGMQGWVDLVSWLQQHNHRFMSIIHVNRNIKNTQRKTDQNQDFRPQRYVTKHKCKQNNAQLFIENLVTLI